MATTVRSPLAARQALKPYRKLAGTKATAGLLGFGGRPKPARRARKPRPELSEAERHERDCERAFRCGARYSANGWVRRPPPRICGPARGPRGIVLHALQCAFFRGYESATRVRIAHARTWGYWPAEASD